MSISHFVSNVQNNPGFWNVGVKLALKFKTLQHPMRDSIFVDTSFVLISILFICPLFLAF